jgi:hypothetical protein
MAAFPVISSLTTVHLYGHFRADQSANGTAGTFSVIAEDSRQVSGSIKFAGGGYQMLGTERDTKLTAFAQLLRNFDRPFYSRHFSVTW